MNPKGELQEILQGISGRSPSYQTLSQEGPDHCKTFISAVIWQGKKLGQGSGASKKEAESNAALDALADRLWIGDDEVPTTENESDTETEDESAGSLAPSV